MWKNPKVCTGGDGEVCRITANGTCSLSFCWWFETQLGPAGKFFGRGFIQAANGAGWSNILEFDERSFCESVYEDGQAHAMAFA